MLEILLVAAVAAALALVALAPWTGLLQIAALLLAAGMLLGVPAGFVYHVQLRRRLLARGLLRPRWWWSPVREHVRLPDEDLSRVLPWFYAGGAGFLLTAVGCVLGLLAVPGAVGWVGGG